jgi:hypothetical protein
MLQLVHVIQHFGCKFIWLPLWVNHYLVLNLIGVPPRHNLFIRTAVHLLMSPRTFLPLPVVYLIHPPIVDVVPVLNRQPRVLFNVITELLWLQADYVKFR